MVERIDGASLEGVSATTLWTLRNRAEEALRGRSVRADAVLDDPLAVELYRRIDYDFEKFGKPSQSHPLRALAFDRATGEYLRTHPNATVVALGEGLQTSFWRLGRPDLRWVSVDLPAVIDVRSRLLPDEASVTSLPVSALDLSWMDAVDPADGVFVTAEGLLMYLEERQVYSLVEACAQCFPGGQLIFDSIPRWFRDKTLKGLKITDRYTAPPMPFALTVSEAARLPERIPGVASVEDIMLPPGRGPWGNRLLRRLTDVPILRDQRPSISLLTFGS